MKKNQILKIVSSLLISAGLLTGCANTNAGPDGDTEKLVFAGISFSEDVDTYDSYALLIELLEDELGVEVEFYETTSYSAIVEGLISGQIQMAQMNQLSYALAKKNVPDLDLIGVTAPSATAPLTAFGYGIKRAENSDINSLEDLRGKRVCFPDPLSTTGYLTPAKALFDLGINANPTTSNDLEPVFAGGFLEVGYGVQRGDCDAGFLNELTFSTLLPATGKIKDGELVPFWTSPNVPNPPLVISGSLPQELRDQIKEVVLTMANRTALVEAGYCTSEDTCTLIATNRWGWRKETDDAFKQIQETCAVLKIKECN